MNYLTDKQQRVLKTICEYRREHDYSPTVRELGELLGISSPNGVKCHLNALRRDGYVTWDDNRSRTLRVLKYT